jgi:ABC transporter substrate binding protein
LSLTALISLLSVEGSLRPAMSKDAISSSSTVGRTGITLAYRPFEYDFLVRDGGLMSYGPDQSEMFDSAADLAWRILKGADLAQLPLEAPSKFVLAINMKTAAAIGLTIPPSLLARADTVIE